MMAALAKACRIDSMSNSNNQAWKTKYGARRVRRELPTLDEAIFAAQGLSDDLEQQADIAASLMGLPLGEVRAVLRRMPRNETMPIVAMTGPASTPRAVVVERKPSRRVNAGARSLRPGTAAPRWKSAG
jgi:hypothetical protein